MPTTRILIIIPAYNEADSIGHVIDDITTHLPGANIVVVNDGSTDDTETIARSKGVNVLSLPYNLGIGGAVQTGYKFAVEQDYDIAVQVDGDGQHPASGLPDLIDTIKRNEADLVIGSRYIEKDGREIFTSRYCAKWLLSIVITLLIKQRITDSSSGFRAANRRAMRFFAKNYPRDYPEPETVALLVKEHFRVKEIPVKMIERCNGKSSITNIIGVYYVFKVMLAVAINMFEKRITSRESAI